MIIGGGGHGRVVAEAAQLGGRFDRVAVIDEKAIENWRLPFVDCFASERELGATPDAWSFVVAIGHAPTRRRLFASYSLAGFRPACVLHPAAAVSRSADVEDGAVILAGAVVASLARIGQGAIVNHNAVVEHDCQVAAFAHVAPGGVMAGGSSLGEDSFLGACASIRHGVTVAGGITIGNGAAVSRSLEEPGTYLGVPARRLGRD
jgi:sugar O-acyltransferase (sialic acid O-acetyltransferase NeuD family)